MEKTIYFGGPILTMDKTCKRVEAILVADGKIAARGTLAEMEIRPAQIPAKTNELRKAMNDALQAEWQPMGISVAGIALNPITLNPEDMKKIQEMEDSMSYGQNAFMMGGRMTTATANAMETAAGNTAGAMTGFMGMGMAGGAMGGGFGAAQGFYNAGMQQQAQQAAGGWKCACGAVNTGKFCSECGAKKPEEGWKCACGADNTGNFCTNCGAKKP